MHTRLLLALSPLLLSGCCLNQESYKADIKKQVAIGTPTAKAVEMLNQSHFQCDKPSIPYVGDDKRPYITCTDTQRLALWRLCSCMPHATLILSSDRKTVIDVSGSSFCWGYGLG